MAENNVTKDKFNNLIEKLNIHFNKVYEEIEVLKEGIATLLENNLEMLEVSKESLAKIKELEKMLLNKTQTEVNTDAKPVMDLNLRVKHNIEAIKELYNTTSDDFTKKFCNSIMVNGYDTITQKQYNKLLELANNANYNKDLKL
jgi:hypothetical protein